jgi:predicted transcriptional regulator of viral defense system
MKIGHLQEFHETTKKLRGSIGVALRLPMPGSNVSSASSYQFQNMEFRFFRVKRTLFFGYSKERADGRVVNMAEKEKVILDYLSLRRNAVTLSLVFEKLKEHKDAFDFSKMTDYAKTHNLTIQRNLGFLLDAVGVSTDNLYEIVRKKKTGFSKMHANAKTFNAKWRLYYDPGVTH